MVAKKLQKNICRSGRTTNHENEMQNTLSTAQMKPSVRGRKFGKEGETENGVQGKRI